MLHYNSGNRVLVTSVCTMGHRTSQTIPYPSLLSEKKKTDLIENQQQNQHRFPGISNNISSSIKAEPLRLGSNKCSNDLKRER
jgi:hypothetical protein